MVTVLCGRECKYGSDADCCVHVDPAPHGVLGHACAGFTPAWIGSMPMLHRCSPVCPILRIYDHFRATVLGAPEELTDDNYKLNNAYVVGPLHSAA